MSPLPRILHLPSSFQCLFFFFAGTRAAGGTDSEFYCGSSWIDAFQNCHQPCPSGLDSECTQAAGHSCHGYTGCAAEASIGDDDDAGDGGGINDGGSGGGIETEAIADNIVDDTYKNNMCGTSWLTAMLSCSTPCPPGTDCPGVGQTCFAATNCDKPMEPVMSRMIMSLLGDYDGAATMGFVERGVFSESVLEYLAARMEENRVAINGADVTGQSQSAAATGGGGGRGGRRRLLQWKDDVTGSAVTVELGAEEHNRQQRRLPIGGSSALDVSMTITGEYRPPPYQDIDLLIEESINRASQSLVREFRQRGSRGGTQFFERVEDLTAVRVTEATDRPTTRPTRWPTLAPTTATPTDIPTDYPTGTPSTSPMRSWEQMLQSGSGSDLYEGTARSFGNLFEVKTKPGAETVIVKGIEFYSAADPGSWVSYEVWTKLGPWQGFEGNLKSFEKIAQGKAISRGTCDGKTMDPARCDEFFSRIPFDEFKKVAILGGGGSRSFYITLATKEIMYKRGESTDINNFSVQKDTPDIEIYEGAGVLVYPFSEATEEMHYRKPRGFLGRIWYDRNPCKDGGMDWPCQTRSPVTQLELTSSRPTKRPTRNPTRQPTKLPTLRPTTPPPTSIPTRISQNITVAESELVSTSPPSPKPVVEYLYDEADVTTTNLGLTLHNVYSEPMNDREKEKYSEVVLTFLQSQHSLQAASVDVLNITIHHQRMITYKKKTQAKGKRRVSSGFRALEDNIPSGQRVRRGKTGKGFIPSGEATASVEYTTISALDVTTIIKTANSVLPSDVTDVLLLHVIEEEKAALIDRFHQESFYSLFLNIDDVTGRIILKVTPSPAPNTFFENPSANADVEVLGIEEGTEKMSTITGVGVGAGAIWCVLTFISLCYLLKVRNKMTNEWKLRNGHRTKQPKEDDVQESYVKSDLALMDRYASGLTAADDVCREDSGETMLIDEFFNGSGHSEDEEGSAFPDQQPTFVDPFLVVSTRSGEDDAASSTHDKHTKVHRRSKFADRLQDKLSGADQDAPQTNADRPHAKTLSGENEDNQKESQSQSGINAFGDRLKHKRKEEAKSSRNRDEVSKTGGGHHRQAHTSFNDRLQEKLSGVDRDAPKNYMGGVQSKKPFRDSSVASKEAQSAFNDRLQEKLSGVDRDAPKNYVGGVQSKKPFRDSSVASKEAQSAFNDRLQEKLSGVDRDAPENYAGGLQSNKLSGNSGVASKEAQSAFNDRLQVELSGVDLVERKLYQNEDKRDQTTKLMAEPPGSKRHLEKGPGRASMLSKPKNKRSSVDDDLGLIALGRSNDDSSNKEKESKKPTSSKSRRERKARESFTEPSRGRRLPDEGSTPATSLKSKNRKSSVGDALSSMALGCSDDISKKDKKPKPSLSKSRRKTMPSKITNDGNHKRRHTNERSDEKVEAANMVEMLFA